MTDDEMEQVRLEHVLDINYEHIYVRMMCFFKVALNLFFTALSLRPGSIRAISLHLFPRLACSLRMMASSEGVQNPFLMPVKPTKVRNTLVQT